MSKLATQKRNNKNLSRFQKMWQHLERLKADIAQRDQDLDALAKRIGTEVLPEEREAARGDIAVVLRLLDLGQRKSWGNWQRQEIEDWIHQSLRTVAVNNLLDDDLRNEVARYDAFRMGVEIDENDGRSPGEQLNAIFDEQQQQEADDEASIHAQFAEQREALVERALDDALGPRPKNLAADNATSDLQGEDRDKLIAQQQQDYDQQRAAMRKDITEQMQQSFDKMLQDEFADEELGEYGYDESFDFDADDIDENPFEKKDSAFKLDNATVQRMFRSAAAVLHPDREADPEKRLVKQKLMQQLLAARKSGDVMTLLSLYQEYVESGEALSKEDEQQLIGALMHQVAELEENLEYYTPESQLHETAYGLYSPNKKQVEKNIKQYLKELERHKDRMINSAISMRSMNALKPMLEERNHMRMAMARESMMAEFYDY